MTTQPIPTVNGNTPEEIDRVRELILGPERAYSRLQQAEVDRLRTIIFGAQIEEYNRQIADLRHALDRAQRDLHATQDRLLTVEQTQLRRLDSLEQDLRQAGDELRSQSERQRLRDEEFQLVQVQLQQQDLARQGLATLASDLRTAQERMGSEARGLHNTVNDYREASDRQGQALKREIRQADDTLRAELRRITDRLDHQKPDRRALAAMFIEVAARLESGDSMTGVFEALGRSE